MVSPSLVDYCSRGWRSALTRDQQTPSARSELRVPALVDDPGLPVKRPAPACAAGLEFSFDDAKVRCELQVVSFHPGDELVGVLAADERLDGVAERMVKTRAEVDDGEDEQRRNATSAHRRRASSGRVVTLAHHAAAAPFALPLSQGPALMPATRSPISRRVAGWTGTRQSCCSWRSRCCRSSRSLRPPPASARCGNRHLGSNFHRRR